MRRKTSSPFIKKFATKEGRYIYDVNSNFIFKVNEVIFDIIDFVPNTPDDQIVARFKGKYPEKLIWEKIKVIKECQNKKGYFLPRYPQIMYRRTLAKIKKKLAGNIWALTLVSTEDCNLRCFYCAYNWGGGDFIRPRRQVKLNWRVAKRAIDFYYQHSRKEKKAYLFFYGGEPFLNFPVIRKSIEYFRKKFVGSKKVISLVTNGTIMNEEIVRFLIKNKVHISVSIDGPREIHDKFRYFSNRSGSFDLIMKNLKRLREANYKYYQKYVNFISILTPVFADPESMKKREKFFHNLKIGQQNVYFRPVNTMGIDLFRRFLKGKEYPIKYQDNFGEIYKKIVAKGKFGGGNIVIGENFKSYFKKIKDLKSSSLGKVIPANATCIPGFQIYVDPKGNIYMCQMIEYDLPIGHIDKGFDYKKIKKITDDYAKMSEPRCLTCWLNRLCDICYIHSVWKNKLSPKQKQARCRALINNFSIALPFYYAIEEKKPVFWKKYLGKYMPKEEDVK